MKQSKKLYIVSTKKIFGEIRNIALVLNKVYNICT